MATLKLGSTTAITESSGTLTLGNQVLPVGVTGGSGLDALVGANVIKIVAVNGATSDLSTSNTNFSSLTAMTDSSITIDVSSASSRVLLMWVLNTHIGAGNGPTPIAGIYAHRDGTNIGCIFGSRNYTASTSVYIDKTTTAFLIDHPNTTGNVVYSLRCATTAGSFYYNRIWVDDVDDPRQRIIAMELAGMLTSQNT